MKRSFFLPIEVDALREATKQTCTLIPLARGREADTEEVARCVLEAAAESGTVDPTRLTDEACARLGFRPASRSFH